MLKKIAAALACTLLLGACQGAPGGAGTAESADAYHKITAEEAHTMMAEQTVTIVDVRTAEEYAGGHVAHALLLPNEEIGAEPPAALPDPEATLLVYCRSGRRSKEASQKLVALGYRNVYDFGGILDWPYDTTTE